MRARSLPSRPPGRTAVTALSLTLVIAACAIGGDFGVPRACTSDAQCSSGQVCVDIGCVSPNQDLVVQVIPPPALATTLATQDFAHVDDTVDIDLQLGPLATLDLTSSLFPFTVSLTGTPLHIPDVPYVLPAIPTVTIPTQLGVSPGNYQLLATPTDGITPPIEAEAGLDSPGASLALPLQFHTPDELVQIDGTLTGPGAFFGGTTLTYSLQVLHADGTPASQPALAAAPDGGNPDGGYLANSLAFSLFVAPTDSPGEGLHLAANPLSGIGPSLNFQGRLSQLQGLALDGGLTLGSATPKTISGAVVDPSGNPVVGASVKLLADLPAQAHFASATVTTDDGGIFVATCLHDGTSELGEDYQVQVVPPANSSLAMLEAAPTATWTGQQASFTTISLTNLTVVSGEVLDNMGNAVTGAFVQATPTSDNILPLTSANATTAVDGSYQVALSPGVYHFDFTPPLSLQAPSASRGPITVSGASTKLPDLQFSPARLVSGKITGPDGSAVAAAQILVFFVQDGASSSTLLARGQSLPDGSFTVVLPAASTSAK